MRSTCRFAEIDVLLSRQNDILSYVKEEVSKPLKMVDSLGARTLNDAL